MKLIGPTITYSAEQLKEIAAKDLDRALAGLGQAHRYVAYVQHELSECEARYYTAQKPAFRKKDEGGVILASRRGASINKGTTLKEAKVSLQESEDRIRALFLAAQTIATVPPALEPVNYDVRTGDVISLPDIEGRAFLVTDTYPGKARMTEGNDTFALTYEELCQRKAVYVFKRPTVAGPRPASFTGGHL